MNKASLPNKRLRYLANVILISLSFLFFALTIIKAQRLAITNAEATAYANFVQQTVQEIMLNKNLDAPNKHVLDTLFSKASVYFFGLSPFSLRLPNVIFALVFFWNAAWMCKNLKTLWAQVFAFLILTVHVYFFDFFALSLGYGLSIALLMATVHHFYYYYKLKNGKHTYRMLIFAGLSVYANFSFLYFYAALMCVLPLLAFADGPNNRKAWFSLIRAQIIISLILSAFIFMPLRDITNVLSGNSDYFWPETVNTLIKSMLYQNDNSWVYSTGFIIGVVLVLALVMLIADRFVSKEENHFFYQPILLLLLGTALFQIAQHLILGTNYFTGRNALVFAIPVFTLVVFLIERIDVETNHPIVRRSLFAVVAATMVVHFIWHFNFRSTLDWAHDSANRKLIKDLAASETDMTPVLIGSSDLLSPSLQFYANWKYSSTFTPLTEDNNSAQPNYYALWPQTDSVKLNYATAQNWEKVKTYKNGLELYKLPKQ
jgi:hypothetical protein